MRQIHVILNVDEDGILKESSQAILEDAISQELNWLHDSGMYVESWSYGNEDRGLTLDAMLDHARKDPQPVNQKNADLHR